MNSPIRLAQASTQTDAAAIKVVKIEKPAGGQAITIELSYDQSIKVDFSAIGNERVVIVRVGERAVILFDNGATVTLDPFFDSLHRPLKNLQFEFANGAILTGEQVATFLPFTDDQSILPAADGTDPREAGADFNPAVIDAILAPPLNELMPPEFLPPIEFHANEAPALTSAPQFGLIETATVDEDFLPWGNEDQPFPSDGDNDGIEVDVEIISVTSWGDNGNNAAGRRIFFSNDDVGVRDEAGNLIALTSNGVTVQYVLLDGPAGDDTVLVGYTGVAPTQADYDPVTGLTGFDGLVFIAEILRIGLNNWFYTFTLHDQLDHPYTDDPNNPFDTLTSYEDNLVFTFSITARNGVGLEGNTTFNTVVDDDSPVVTDKQEIRTINEDDIQTGDGNPTGSLGTSPQDGNADGSFTGNPGDGVPGPATITGSLTALVNIGADEQEPVFEFVDGPQAAAALAALNGLGLSSKGVDLVFSFVGGNLVAMAGDRLVMRLILQPDGSYTFELHDQVDHDTPYDDFPTFPVLPGDTQDPDADQNHDLQNDGSGDVVFIDFGSLIKASDFDNDSVTLDGKLQIAITDDIPEVKHHPLVLKVDEDDIVTNNDGLPGGSLGNHPEDGNDDGSYTGEQGVDNGGPATVQASLQGAGGVVESGADESLTFSFVQNATQIFQQLGLTSKGETLAYSIENGVLYGYAINFGGGDVGYDEGIDRLVFKFTLEGDGDIKFELFDQLDHDAPDFGNSDQNYDLEVPGEDIWFIDFGQIINATDYDHDTVNLEGKVLIKVRDDVPEIQCGEKVFGVVEEEELHKGNEDNFPDPYDQDPPSNDTTAIATGNSGNGNSLNNLVKVGADEKGKFTFKDSVDEGDVIRDKDNNVVKSDGKDVKITDIVHGNGFTVITAGTTGPGGTTVFILTVWENGDWKFELKDQVDHHPKDQADNAEGLMYLDFSGLIEFTDFDFDSVNLEDCSFLIKVIDDTPIAEIKIDSSGKLIHDETPGDDGQDDVGYFDLPSFVRAAFDDVDNRGNDPDVGDDHGAIGYARDTGLIQIGNDTSVGADQPGTVTLAFLIVGGNGVDSGLRTTDNQVIRLYLEDGLVVGRIPPVGEETVGKAVFAIHIENDGDISVAQWLSIRHDDVNDHDENNDNGNSSGDDGPVNEFPNPIQQSLAGKLKVVLTVTDEDGDTATDEADIGHKIIFEDDGPKAKSNDKVTLEDDDLAPNGIEGGPGDDNAPQNASGNLEHSYGADGPGGIKLLGVDLPNGLGFSQTLNPEGTLLTISQNGTPVLEIKLTNTTTGAYEVKQLAPINHPTLNGQNGDDTENNVEFKVKYRVTDGDGDWHDGELKIDVDDDTPKLTGRKEEKTIDEDDIDTAYSKGTSPDDGAGTDGSFTGSQGTEDGDSAGFDGPANVSGSLVGTVSSGADVPLTFSFINNPGSVLNSLGLKSQGGTIAYSLAGNVLTGYVNVSGAGYQAGTDRLVFTLTLTSGGNYTFELHDQIDHDAPFDTVTDNVSATPGADENTDLQDSLPGNGDVNAIDFGSVIQATDNDGDSVILENALKITITDDIPQVSGGACATVDEGDIVAGQPVTTTKIFFSVSDDGSVTGVSDFDDEDVIQRNVEAGTYELFFNGGANGLGGSGVDIDALHVFENGTFVFSLTDSINNLGGVGSNDFDDDDLILWNGSGFSLYQSLPNLSDENIDAISIMADGDIIFSISNDTGSVTGVPSFGDEDLIRWDSATNTYSLFFDGSANGLGASGVDIDALHVFEDGTFVFSLTGSINNLGGVGSNDFDDDDLILWNGSSYSLYQSLPNLSDENIDAISIRSTTTNTTTPATATINASLLVTIGTDEHPTYGITVFGPTDFGDIDDADGNPVSISSNGTTLTGTANGETVFTVTVNPTTGEVTFSLFKELDHGALDILELDFGPYIYVKDFDNDQVWFGQGKIKFKVEDGNEEPTISVTDSQVDEAALDAANNGGDAGSNAVSTNETTSGTITFTPGDTPSTVTIGGVAVTGVGQTFNGTYGILTITAWDPNGSIGWSYTLSANTLDHLNTTSTGTSEGIDDDFAVVVTDNDGESASDTLNIAILDDGPQLVISGSQEQLAKLNLDESIDPDGNATPNQDADYYGSGDPDPKDNNGDNDDTTNTVADPSGTNPFGVTTTTAGVLDGLFTQTKTPGADGEKSYDPTLTLALYSNTVTQVGVGVGVATTLKATQPALFGNPDSDGVGNNFTPYADNNIFLFLEADGTITGRVGNSASGPIAFKVSLTTDDPTTAQLKVEQFLAIEHPTNPNSYDEEAILGVLNDTSGGLAGIALNLAATLTDGDDDTASDDHHVFITNKIAFDDDGPKTGVTASATEVVEGETITGTYQIDPGTDGLKVGQGGSTVTFIIDGTPYSFTPSVVFLTGGTEFVTPFGNFDFEQPDASGNGTWSFTPNDVLANKNVEIKLDIFDNDGDKATASVQFTILDKPDLLIVGSNLDDNASSPNNSDYHHTVNPAGPTTTGTIQGEGGDDILVGDPGALPTITQGASANIVLVLDVSESMNTNISFNGGTTTRIEAMEDAVKALLDQLAATGASNIRVHVVQFAIDASAVATFDVTINNVDQNMTTIKNTTIENLNTFMAAGTNYEAGLFRAYEWITTPTGPANAPLAGATVNKVLFVSDGEPNTYMPGEHGTPGTVTGAGFSQLALNHMLGVAAGDTSNEVTMIENLGYTIEAIGINLGGTALDVLDQVEGVGGDATSITTAEQLNTAVGNLAGGATIAATTGGDTINGAAGNDIIFGDVLWTDALADARGLGHPDDSGWQVFADLEASLANATGPNPDPGGDGLDWTRLDTIAYIKANPFQLAQEAPRKGGDDTITGGTGDDLIFAQEGNDDIFYVWGDGHDFVHGGVGKLDGNGTPVADHDQFFLDITGAGGTVFMETVAEYELRTGNDYIFGGAFSTDALNGTDFATSGITEGQIILISLGNEVFVELYEIEEIVVSGSTADDVFVIDGSFTGTALSPNTIVFNGLGGDDTLDLSGRDSAHRVVADGGADTDTVLLDFEIGDIEGITPLGGGLGVAIEHDGIIDEFTNFENFTFKDGAGTVTKSLAEVLAFDPIPPELESIVLSDSALKIGDTATVTVTFSEAVQNLEIGDFTAPNGTLSALSSSDGGMTWTMTFTPDGGVTDNSNAITLTAGSYTDLAGNPGAGGSSANYEVDTMAPTVTVNIVDSSQTDGNTSSNITFEFSENVSGFTAGDITPVGGTITGFTQIDGNSYSATFNATNGFSGTGSVTVNANSYQDAAGNLGATGSDTVPVDRANPTATITMSDTALGFGETATVTITFSEAVSGFSNSDVTAQNGSLTTFVSGDGGVIWTATFTPNTNVNDPTNVITLTNSYQDAVGNGGTSASSLNYTINTVLPSVSVSNASDVTEGSPLQFTISLNGVSNTPVVLSLAAAGAAGGGNPAATAVDDFETSGFQYSTDGGDNWLNATGPGTNQVTIPQGQTSILVRVDTVNDTADESDQERMSLTATIVSGNAAAGDMSGNGDIVDNDFPPLAVNEATSATGRFAHADSNPSPGTISFDLANLFTGGTPTIGYAFTQIEPTSGWPFSTSGTTISDNPSDSEAGIYAGKVVATDNLATKASTYVAFSVIEDGGTSISVTGSSSASSANSNDGDLIQLDGSYTGSVSAGGGHDVIIGNNNGTTINGGNGEDAIYGMGGGDTLNGDAGNDFLDGGAGDDTLNGGADIDVLVGGAGNDILDGGAGADFLDGGTGSDDFRFDLTTEGGDTILNFETGLDEILVDNGNFGLGSLVGDLSSSQFAVVSGTSGTVGGNVRILFNTTDNNLYYDSNGGSWSTATLIQLAHIENGSIELGDVRAF